MPKLTFQYQCDTSRDVIWCHNFWPTAPLRPRMLKFAYLDFPRSNFINPKHIGPGYATFRHMYLISWPKVTFQYRCETSRDVIWCHDFWPTAPLRPNILKFAHAGFPNSVFGNPKHIGHRYATFRDIYLIQWPKLAFQYRCDTSHDVTWCHDSGPTAPLRPQTLKFAYLGFPSPVFDNRKHADLDTQLLETHI